MAKLTIDIGTGAGNGDGEVLYDAFGKVNANFTELYNDKAPLDDARFPTAVGVTGDTVVGAGTVLAAQQALDLEPGVDIATQAALDAIQVGQSGEYKLDGTLVYPSWVAQTLSYKSDGSLDYYQTTNTYLAKIWRLAMTYTGDNITTITATEDYGGTPINRTKQLTYNIDGSLATEGDWT
jgi:hypothetical protein